MSHPGSSRTARPLLARLGVAALGLAIGAGGLAATPSYAATIDGLTGTGTAADPIVIDSAADLDAAAAAVNGDHATYGALAYRLGADIDYADGTFASFRRFSGVLDGNGHEITDLTLQPGTVADAADANATQTGFVQSLEGTIRDLTLKRLTAVTTGGTSARVQVGGFAARSSGGTITGSALIDSAIASPDNTDNSSAVGGFVGKTVAGTNRISDSLLSGTSVSGDKRVGGVVGWQNAATTVAGNLVVDASAAQHGGSGAGAALVTGHSVCVGTVTGNVVVSGAVEQVAAANYGWVRSGSGCTSTGNLVTAANNIDPSAPVGHTTAPDPNPYDLLWTGSSLLSAGAPTWIVGDLGTYVPAADLAQQATYEALGWDFTPGTGDWRWAADLEHPVPVRADLDGYDEIAYRLNGGTNGAPA
jgi:hypothetical protein